MMLGKFFACVCIFFSFSLKGNDVSHIVASVGVEPEKSALLITRLDDVAVWSSGGSRIDTLYPPASTAKIPHTLIALEEGYAKTPNSLFAWDGVERSLPIWNQDHTLRTAYKCSAVWVFQQITRDLGYETMSHWIDRLEYGNRYIGSPENITTYWLKGPLLTSARLQSEFLARLANEKLPLKPQTFRLGKQIMLEDSGSGWCLYAKSGFSGSIGWYVGWVEKHTNDRRETYTFAFNMDIDTWDELPKRQEVVNAALRALLVKN